MHEINQINLILSDSESDSLIFSKWLNKSSNYTDEYIWAYGNMQKVMAAVTYIFFMECLSLLHKLPIFLAYVNYFYFLIFSFGMYAKNIVK